MRKKMLKIAIRSLKRLKPEALFQKTLTIRKKLTKTSLLRFENIVVIGIGKAAPGMAKSVIGMMGRKPTRVLFASKGHPIPTELSISNTRRIVEASKKLTEHDLAIVLLSGGGSAMLELPIPPIKLEDIATLTKSLLQCGAPIQEINVVRKHLSQVKGGKLAQLLFPATVWGFIISDVPGSDLSTIASGPISPDSSSVRDAKRILKKYRLRLPHGSVLQETPKPGDPYFKRVTTAILADHRTTQNIVLEEAKKAGLRAYSMPHLITGEARDAAERFVKKAQQKLKKYDMVVAVGETTVTCRGKGAGGRNQEFVLSGLRFLKPGQTLLSIGTDGCDGICPETIAGAVADAGTIERCRKKKLHIEDFLQRNDSYHFFKKTGGLIKTGKTGTNVGDLMLLCYTPGRL